MSDQKTDELRAATREANETLKDLRRALKDGEDLLRRMGEVKEDLLVVSQHVFEDRMNQHVADGLVHYTKVVDAAIESATQAVYDRFDSIVRIVVGKATDEDKSNIRLMVERIERNRGEKIIERP